MSAQLSFTIFNMYPTGLVAEMKTSMLWKSLPMIMIFEPRLARSYHLRYESDKLPGRNKRIRKQIRLVPKSEADITVSVLVGSHSDNIPSLRCFSLRAFCRLLH